MCGDGISSASLSDYRCSLLSIGGALLRDEQVGRVGKTGVQAAGLPDGNEGMGCLG